MNKLYLTLSHDLNFKYYYGEILENKRNYYVMRVTHSASSLELADKIPYKDVQYPDGIRTFYKSYAHVARPADMT